MTTKKIPTTISAPTTNSDTMYTGAPGQIVPTHVPATYQYPFCDSTITVRVQRTKYADGNLALVLMECTPFANEEVPFTRVSINMPEVPLGEDEIIVKDYSENKGMAQWLYDNNIAIYTTTSVIMMPHGNICPIMKLL